MAKRQRLSAAGVALFFIMLMLIGLFTLRDYSAGYDETVQQNSLRVNLKEYAVQLSKLGIRWQYGLDMLVPSLSEYVDRDYGLSPMYVCLPAFSGPNG